MCGITGAVPGIDAERLARMTATLIHRGPDGEGYFSSPEVSLGHRRLAIIDLPGGRQPMTSADGRMTIVFNGEIYNFRELRRELESHGTIFRTRSDTEVLLEAWAEWGLEAIPRLRGMFAFAVWDAGDRSLVLVRDRLGVKPLYYAEAAGRLLFASEIKALLAHPDVSRRLYAPAVEDYLTYLYTPPPRTIFEGVRELPPAHWLRWRDGKISTACYWDALPQPADDPLEKNVEELRAVLGDAVEARLESDVPLGSFLSGGIDSSSIVALMSRNAGAPVRSFSLGFGAGAEHYTELEYARLVAAKFATDHRELEIEPRCADLLPRMVGLFDVPFGNPTALLLYSLSELTRRHVTVALTGDAGDEVFLGYPRYLGVRLRRFFDAVPRPLRRALGALSARFQEDINGFHARRRLREFISSGAAPWQQAYTAWVSYFTPEMRGALYTPEFRAAVGAHSAEDFLAGWFARVAGSDPLSQASYADLHSFLPHNLLQYGDRMSMAHALELRQPFTDHHVVEFAMRLPAKQKLGGRQGKLILREAMRPMLPREILERPKLGLNPPMSLWLQNELQPLVERYLSPEAVRRRGWFRPETVAGLVTEFRSGRRDYSLHLWALLVLEEWCRQFLDGNAHDEQPARLAEVRA
jgi:asparagine synthase (glutamine-hydrolysing)